MFNLGLGGNDTHGMHSKFSHRYAESLRFRSGYFQVESDGEDPGVLVPVIVDQGWQPLPGSLKPLAGLLSVEIFGSFLLLPRPSSCSPYYPGWSMLLLPVGEATEIGTSVSGMCLRVQKRPFECWGWTIDLIPV